MTDPETLRIIKSLCLLADKQGKSLADKPEQRYCAHGDGACVITKAGTVDWNILSLRYAGMVHESSFKGQPSAIQQDLMCHAVMNAVVSAGERRESLEECSVYCASTKPCHECEALTMWYNTTIKESNTEFTHEDFIEVDLKESVFRYENKVNEYSEGTALLKSGSSQSEQSFFPLAIDDYFMAVAILTGRKSEGSCCVIVTHEPPCVVSSSTQANCPEGWAVSRAHRSRVDLTKCILYTTKSPCLECTKVILQAGIRVVVHGGDIPEETKDLVYQTKACFKKYGCHIRVADDDKKFLIDLNECIVHAKKLEYKGPPPQPPPPPPHSPLQPSPPNPPPLPPLPHSPPHPARADDMKKPTYRDFFMAMAFLASARSKDNVTQVGACLVTQAPHRLVAMGYNGMPDGRGFKDEKMDWGSDQSNYICHAELNAIIAAFRRMADLSSCTLYVTHSPCEDCSNLIAQSGIKNVVFAKYYKEGKHMYKCLGHTPDMNITHYEYKDSGYGNGAKIRIDLGRLNVTTTKSEKPPAPTTAPIITSVEVNTTPPGITVEWEALDCHCNGVITGYSVQCEEKDGRDKQERHVPSNTTEATFGRLMPSTTYNFRVAAMNSSGIGVYSVAKSLNTECDRYASTEHYTVKGRREVNLPLDDYFMALAVLATTRSPNKDPVGACIVLQEPRRAISVGYNGFPEGYKGKRTTSATEDYNECCAEHNAIVSAFRYHADLTNCILYTTAPPCHKCAQMIVQSGIKTVVYGKGSETMSEQSDEIFYWAKVATLDYKLLTKKRIITIDLHGQTVEQKCTFVIKRE